MQFGVDLLLLQEVVEVVFGAAHCNSKLKVNNCKVISITEVQEVRISGTVLK